MPKAKLEINIGLPKSARFKDGAYRFRATKKEAILLGRSEIKLGKEFDIGAQQIYATIMDCLATGKRWHDRNPYPAHFVEYGQWEAISYAANCKIPISTLKSIYSRSRSGAKKRNLSFAIMPKDVVDLAIKADGRCMLTGIEWDFLPMGKSGRAPFSPSLDRIDSGAGYVRGNLRMVCFMANVALSDFGDLAWKRIVNAMRKDKN